MSDIGVQFWGHKLLGMRLLRNDLVDELEVLYYISLRGWLVANGATALCIHHCQHHFLICICSPCKRVNVIFPLWAFVRYATLPKCLLSCKTLRCRKLLAFLPQLLQMRRNVTECVIKLVLLLPLSISFFRACPLAL